MNSAASPRSDDGCSPEIAEARDWLTHRQAGVPVPGLLGLLFNQPRIQPHGMVHDVRTAAIVDHQRQSPSTAQIKWSDRTKPLLTSYRTTAPDRPTIQQHSEHHVTTTTDPETGQTDGILTLALQRGFVPKVINTYTSSEYWAGGGAMMHIDLSGSRDLAIPDQIRNFHFGGCQHSLGETRLQDRNPENGTHGQHPFNCVDYRPLLRGALVSLDRWVTSGQVPPASRYPRLDNDTAVTPNKVTEIFSKIPRTNTPNPVRRFYRMDFGPESGISANVPPRRGSNYPILVSAVDQDGNELAGIQMPLIAVPLASYTGWSLRHANIGGTGQTLASGGATGGTLLGSTIPFPATREEREATGDPRLSIEERYASKESYLDQIRQAAQQIIEQDYMLSEDLDRVIDQASEHYDELSSRVRQPQAADN